jgi:hypothetical protein
VLSANGYTVVFRRLGEVESPSRLLHGGPVQASCWIAVRDGLLASPGRTAGP